MPKSFEESLNEIMSRHTEYAPEAYEFMRDALDFAIEKHGKDGERKLNASALYRGLCEYAVEQFGPMSYPVLNFWGITESCDVGNVVYNLIEAGVFSKDKNDTRREFDTLPSLRDEVEAPYRLKQNPVPESPLPKKPRKKRS